MSQNPYHVACPEGEWVLIAAGIDRLQMWRKKYDPSKHLYTYKIAGNDPPTLQDEGVPIFTGQNIDFEIKAFDFLVDVYVYTQGGDGRIRVDVGVSDVPSDKEAVSAFGDLSVSQFKPQAGWIFAYNLNETIVSTTEILTGTVTHNGAFAFCQTGTDPNGVAFIRSKRALTYAPGIGAVARFTVVFDTPQPESLQLIGVGNDSDGWFFGYNGIKFGIMKRRAGIDEWFYQEDWSEDVKPELNPQKGNVYEIKYQWLGFGMQYFGIENENGDIRTVHRIKYNNLNTSVSVENPSLPLAAGVANLGNTTNLTLKTPSAVAGLDGEPFSPVFEALIAYERITSVLANTETYLFGLQNPDNWLGKDNRLYVLPKLFAAASDGNKPILFRVYSSPTITDPVWVDIAPNISPLQYDISGTWVPNGEASVFSLPLGRADNAQVDLNIIDAEALPRTIYAVTAISQTASDVIVSITFKSRT